MMVFRQTEEFNKKIIGINRFPGTVEDDKEFDWLVGVILEELQEFQDAHRQGDFVAELDSIMDLIYFASGALTRMGINAQVSMDIFLAVHECNMKKAKGKNAARIATHDLDAVKSDEWKGP